MHWDVDTVTCGGGRLGFTCIGIGMDHDNTVCDLVKVHKGRCEVTAACFLRVDHPPKNGSTALTKVAGDVNFQAGRLDIVKLLLQRGADKDHQTQAS